MDFRMIVEDCARLPACCYTFDFCKSYHSENAQGVARKIFYSIEATIPG